MHSGNYVLILHTHLPWVLHHGNWPHGQDWLTEAVAECYIPLLNVFNDLLQEGITAKVTLDISPILCEQLEHPDFKNIFIKYCDEKIESARQDEIDFTSWGYDPHHIYLTRYWQDWYAKRKNDFINRYDHSIINALKELQDKEVIEMMTCGATHGYMPLLGTEQSINLQVKAARENYIKHFGRPPRGTWLPECAYRPSYEWMSYIPVNPQHQKRLRPGVEQFLAKHNIEYFVTDEELLVSHNPLGVFHEGRKDYFVSINSEGFEHKPWNFDRNPLNLYNISSSEKTEFGTAVAFTRHHDISMQVWSGDVGYPGEPNYLDFHKKQIGSMLRYWRVTDNKADMMYKTLYNPDWTRHTIDLQANHFIHNIENTLNFHKNETGKFGTMCTPFDTELFGHWWFEGPEFIKAVIRGIHNSPFVNMVTASEQLDTIKPREVVSIPEGSWGENNTHEVWVNEGTTWTWRAIYDNENRFNEIISKYPPDSMNAQMKRIATQALRELMLLQSSDWQFLIYTQSARDYAEQRFSYHHSDFNRLCNLIDDMGEGKSISENDLLYLTEAEKRNSCFPELDLNWWKDLTFFE